MPAKGSGCCCCCCRRFGSAAVTTTVIGSLLPAPFSVRTAMLPIVSVPTRFGRSRNCVVRSTDLRPMPNDIEVELPRLTTVKSLPAGTPTVPSERSTTST